MGREESEAIERQRLAPYACKSGDSRGREFPEEEHPYRTAYQRDRDRIIHTTAFRRLQHKTQVFITSEGDYYRTRFTHTIEVAQIGRTVARALRCNEDLTEAICLAHDLGHGPFGHSGEEILNELMADYGGFDHNHQSLRIVEKMESRYPGVRGLNLSWEVREGILKHESEYDRGAAFAYDPDKRGSLECQIVNVVDEIAYNTADLDDGLRSGLVDPASLSGVTLWVEALSALGISPDCSLEDIDRHRIIRRLVNAEVTDILQNTARMLEEHGPGSPDEIRSLPRSLVSHSDGMLARNRELKDYLYRNLYNHHRLRRMARKGKMVLERLFGAYVDDPGLLPEHVAPDAQEMGKEKLYRTVCDYVAGMTDRYATREYHNLFTPSEF